MLPSREHEIYFASVNYHAHSKIGNKSHRPVRPYQATYPMGGKGVLVAGINVEEATVARHSIRTERYQECR